MLKFLGKILNVLSAAILPDVRNWSEVLCCTVLTHISDLEVKGTDFEILCFSFFG